MLSEERREVYLKILADAENAIYACDEPTLTKLELALIHAIGKLGHELRNELAKAERKR